MALRRTCCCCFLLFYEIERNIIVLVCLALREYVCVNRCGCEVVFTFFAVPFGLGSDQVLLGAGKIAGSDGSR